MLPRRIQVVDVGPRDRLQNEAVSIAAGDKVAFVDRLTAAGHTEIEVAAFVSPWWVPQVADAAEILAGIARRQGVRYSALVPNLTGRRRAREADVGDIAIFAAASQTFTRRNINQSIAESLAAFVAVCEETPSPDR
jgi:hydroxymethylglutaryl-CoA lyase